MEHTYLCIDPTLGRYYPLLSISKLRALQERRRAEAIKAGLKVVEVNTVKKEHPDYSDANFPQFTFCVDVTGIRPKQRKRIFDVLMSVE